MELSGKKGLTTFDLKILGIVFMFIDHIHQMFSLMGAPGWLDWFGRPVATLFFFISVEGFSHTRNKEKYLFRLLTGFWLMNIGSSLVQKIFTLGDMALSNNIFTDLFVGVLAMYGIDSLARFKETKQVKSLLVGLACLLCPIIFSVIPLVGMTSGNMFLLSIARVFPATLFAENSVMVYLIPVMYLLRKNKKWQCLAIGVVALIFLLGNPSAAFTSNTQWMMIFSVIPILLYNGEKGRGMRSFFYIFYPAHIWLLYIIASIIYNH
ncbi:TraX family protein [Vagococcus carniphilus]|uniref:TraX family protein n=1 Tax=Vagococcus carniphilus TaxID=218144 RepID=A0AAW8U2E7_9ENTE|nr:TraX family protein [Vagococcus carniphilus]MDT2833726.1 TraX family protein [Vagococcus carniphilus]